MSDSNSEDGDRRIRAQSELVGFTLIFGVVVLAIALVGVAGFTGLNSAQDFQRTTNAEQAFTALAGDVDDVVRAGASSRSTEVRIADARLALADPETIRIASDDGSLDATVETRPIVYDSGTGTTLTYHTGALVRQDDDSAVMFREPRFVLSAEEVVLPVVTTTQVHDGPIGGTRAVDVRTRRAGTDVLATSSAVDTVTVNVTTNHAKAWKRHFEAADDGHVTVVDWEDDAYVEVQIETDRVTVTRHRVEVSFE